MDVVMKNEKEKKLLLLKTPQLKELCGSACKDVNSIFLFLELVREDYFFSDFC